MNDVRFNVLLFFDLRCDCHVRYVRCARNQPLDFDLLRTPVAIGQMPQIVVAVDEPVATPEAFSGYDIAIGIPKSVRKLDVVLTR